VSQADSKPSTDLTHESDDALGTIGTIRIVAHVLQKSLFAAISGGFSAADYD
jgi:hypothetical protein